MTVANGKESIEQVTISIVDTRAGALLKIQWRTVIATTAFAVQAKSASR